MRRLLFVVWMGMPGALQADWVNSDVPPTLAPAGAAVEDPPGTWTIDGTGTDIWGTSDEFHYVFDDDPFVGDFAIGCRVVTLGSTPNPWGKAGLMARVGGPDFQGPETYAFCCATTGNGVCLQWRDGVGANAAWDGTAVNQWMVGPDGVWIKLVRNGSVVQGYAALEPPLWVSLNSHFFTNLSDLDEVYLGLALTSHEVGTLARAVIDEVDLDDPGISLAGPTGFLGAVGGSDVILSWTNQAVYDEIVIYREGLDGTLARVSPGPSADVETFVDTPGDGIWTYWISAVDSGMDCLATISEPVVVGDLGYAGEVLADAPVAYWRLSELEGLTAQSIGSAGAAAAGTYFGGVTLEQESLLHADDDPCILLDGLTGEVRLPDHASINTGGPYDARTVELWFLAEIVTTIPGMLFEEGGNTRGINMYVVDVGNGPELILNAWNLAENQWGPIWISTPIEEGEIYHAVLVLVSSANGEVYGDFDGRLTGYLNGDEFDEATGVDRLHAHGDDGAIGGIHTNTRLHDTSTVGDGANFRGLVDEVAVYNIALDDPDGDGDRGDDRVIEHFEAAGSIVEEPVTFRRADTDADGTANITDAVVTLNYLFLGGATPTCIDAADADDSGLLNISDPVYALNYLFLGGPAPPAPFQSCGEDSTADELDCVSFQPCGR